MSDTTLEPPREQSGRTLNVSIAVTGAAAAVATAVLWCVSADLAPLVLSWLAFAQIAAGGLLLAIIDARHQILPNRVLFPLYGSTSALLTALTIATQDLPRLGWAVIGGVALWILFFLLGLAGGVGFGDVKLAGLIGLYLGWFGFAPVVAGVVLAFAAAVPHALASIKFTDKRRISFGPYLIFGMTVAATAALIGLI